MVATVPFLIATFLAATQTAQAATFVNCNDWNTIVCPSVVRAITCLNPTGVCYNPQPGYFCAACICSDGADKGQIAGATAESNYDDATCQAFFLHNVTPTKSGGAPQLTSTITSVTSATVSPTTTAGKSGSSALSVGFVEKGLIVAAAVCWVGLGL
ncbi:hypothetical protein HDU76_010458 [Blyttiomyces sp. JEL0837]|nr:hypothetical protein HDU76_010458 [Blyttiomyces sp. JEL0837]